MDTVKKAMTWMTLATTACAMAGVTLTEDKTVADGEVYATDHDVLIGQDGAPITLSVLRGGKMVNTFQAGRNRGPWVYNKSLLEIGDEGSELKTHQLFVRQGGKISVFNKGALTLNRSIPSSYTDNLTAGSVWFNGGVLRPLVPADALGNLQPGNIRTFAEWFYRVTDFNLDPGGITLDVPDDAYAVLCPSVKTAVEGAKIIKTGAGIVDVDVMNSPSSVPVEVAAGAVKLSRRSPYSPLDEARTLTIDAATTPYVVKGEHAATGATFKPTVSGAGLRLEASVGFGPDAWNRYGNYTKILPTGEIVLVDDAAENNIGAAYLKEKIDVSRSFVLTFDYLGAIGGVGNPYEGFVAVWQNAGEGRRGGMESGYTGDFPSSFACGLRSRGGGFRIGRNGAWIHTDERVNNADIFKAAGTPENRASCRMAYDAAAKTMTFEIYSRLLGKLEHVQADVDLVAITGADQAWFGFTGSGDANRRMDIVLSNVNLSYGEAKLASVKQGGRLDLTAGGAFNVRLATSRVQNGFGLDGIVYAPESELNVADAHTISSSDPAYLTARLSVDEIRGEGCLIKTGAADLALLNAGNDATLRMREGRLVLSDTSHLPLTSETMREFWLFRDGTPDTNGRDGRVLDDGTVQFGANYPSGNRNGVYYAKPVRVDGAWELAFTVDLSGSEKGLSFATMLTTPDKGYLIGGDNLDGGFAGYGTVVNWCIWKDSNYYGKVNVEQWDNGTLAPNWQNGTTLMPLQNARTEVVIANDPVAKQMTVTLRQGETVETATFSRDPARYAEDGFAYLGFGTSGGGSAAAVPKISNLSFTTTDAPAAKAYLKGLDLSTGTTTVVLEPHDADERFLIADTLKSNGGTLSLAKGSASSVATIGAVDGTATVTVPAGVTFELSGSQENLDLVLEDGAAVSVSGESRVHTLTYAGEKIRGTYRTATAPSWMHIPDDGKLKVLFPIRGLLLSVR